MTQKAVEALGRVGSCLLGVVVNGTRESGERYGYYGTYGGGNGSNRRGHQTGKTSCGMSVDRPTAGGRCLAL